MGQFLAIGTAWKVRFRLRGYSKDNYNAVGDVSEVEERPDGVKVILNFTEIDDDQLRVDGQLTLLGITRPLSLGIKRNKEGTSPILPNYVVGFSATGSLKRSDFGMDAYIPLVGDVIRVRLEVEAVRREQN